MHLRLLQELLLASQSAAVSGASNAVEHPGGQGDYAIVAAGIVSGNGTSARSPVYNGLRVNGAPQNGFLTITFNNYKQPDNATFQYIVKVLPVYNSQQAVFFDVSFVGFLLGGFNLRLHAVSGRLDISLAGTLEFMVEVGDILQPEGEQVEYPAHGAGEGDGRF